MVVLRCIAPKASGLASGNYFYVCREAQCDGQTYSTLTKDISRAKLFDDEVQADKYNERMIQAGAFARAFEKYKIKL